MKSLITSILVHIGLASSIFLIMKTFFLESYSRIPIICILIANIFCGYLAWQADNESLRQHIRSTTMECIKEYDSQNLELMEQLPLALPGDEIWSKK
jgi:hypothetical protein